MSGSQIVAALRHEFAGYLVARRTLVEKMSRHTLIPDEALALTFLMASPFADRRDSTRPERSRHLRLTDWSRSQTGAHPYVWREGDTTELLQSDCIFARKFDPDDLEFIAAITETIKQRG